MVTKATVSLACALIIGAQSQAAEFNLVVKDYTELSQMEEAANTARNLYWSGKYQEAVSQMEPLCRESHASTTLYKAERASCYLALGDKSAALRDLWDAAERVEYVRNTKLEQQALSKFGKEAEKVYRGDPYELATGHLLLALLFLDRGDVDNALAACKNGLLYDSDASENRYDSDYALLHLLQAKCHELRGESDAARQSLDAARENYTLTHPTVRSLVSERQDRLALLAMNRKERKKEGCTDDDATLKARIAQLEEQITAAKGKVNVDLEMALAGTGKFNALLLVPEGRVAYKRRAGTEGNVVVFEASQTSSGNLLLELDGQPLVVPPERGLADLQHQATTRGGRQMDAVLRGKASFKRTTSSIGASITEAGNQAGGLGGLAVALIGATVQGVAGSVSPEADTRCWKTLPAQYSIYALELPPGEHTLVSRQFLYFEERARVEQKLVIGDDKRLAVAFAPPTVMGAYSDQCLKTSGSAWNVEAQQSNQTNTTAVQILLPPPLGLRFTEAFPSPDPIKYPRFFAPDPKKIVHFSQSALAGAGITALPVGHNQILNGREELARNAKLALQVELTGLKLAQEGKGETYTTTFKFTLIDAPTGKPLWTSEQSGTHMNGELKKSASTAAFYDGFQQALGAFTRDAEFKRQTGSAR